MIFSNRSYFIISHFIICLGLLIFNVFLKAETYLNLPNTRWNYSDWLTNYSAGFVRRGFWGHWIQTYTDSYTPLTLFLGLIFILTLIILLFWSVIFFLRKDVPIIALIAFAMLPGSLFTNLLTQKYYSRKEIFFLLPLLLISVFYLFLKNSYIKNSTFLVATIFAFIVSVVAILHHESYLLVGLPSLLFIIYCAQEEFAVSRSLQAIALFGVIFCMIAFLSVSLFNGTKEQGELIFSSLTTEDQAIIKNTNLKHKSEISELIFDRTYRAQSVFGSTSREEFLWVAEQVLLKKHLFTWIFIFVLVFLQISTFSKFLGGESLASTYLFLGYFVFNSLLYLPILLLSEDWGRWLSISVQMSSIVLLTVTYKMSPKLLSKKIIHNLSHQKVFSTFEIIWRWLPAPLVLLAIITWKLLYVIPECCLQENNTTAPLDQLFLWINSLG